MRLMTGLAGNAIGVIGGIHLWESFRLCRTRRVASRAKDRRVRFQRRNRCWIFRMLCQWTVAGLAVHMRVLALGFHIQNIAVARLASLVTGELHGSSSNLADGRTAIVSILSEALRNHAPGYYWPPHLYQKMSGYRVTGVASTFKLTVAFSLGHAGPVGNMAYAAQW